MAGVISEYIKIDCALKPSTTADATTYYSEYYDMTNWDKALFIVSAASFTATGTIPITLYQAYTATGGGAAALGVYSTMNSTATADKGYIIGAKAVGITNASSWTPAGATITVNGLLFTAYSTSYVAGASSGQFSTSRYIYSSSAGTHAAGAVEHFTSYINHGTYGCTGLVAIAGGDVMGASSHHVYITALEDKTITIAVGDTASTQFQAYLIKSLATLECNAIDLASGSSYHYVGIGLTPTTKCVIHATLIRSGGRYSNTNTGSLLYDKGVT